MALVGDTGILARGPGEGALAWAAAEFELPSARRVGREEDGDGETPALSQGGAGHLRAAGRCGSELVVG